MIKQIRKLLISFQFLTILPVKIQGDIYDDIAGSTVFFPVVGAFQGAVIVLFAMILRYAFCKGAVCHIYDGIISVLIILILIATNKGLHIDGLADTFDALGVAPTGNTASDIEKRLSAMKDSRIGSIGALSIVFTVLIKFTLINTLIALYPISTAYFFLFIMPAFSKWAMVPAIHKGTPARQDGIGRLFIERISLLQLIASTILLIIITVIAIFLDWAIYKRAYGVDLISMYYPATIFIGITLIILYGFSIVSLSFLKNRFNGITGDTLGAISEISEVLFLFATVIWGNHL